MSETPDPLVAFTEAEKKILADGFEKEQDYPRKDDDGKVFQVQRKYVKKDAKTKKVLYETWLNVPETPETPAAPAAENGGSS